VFLGVVGGAGVKLLSLPLNDEATLLDELAPPCLVLRSKLRKHTSMIELQKNRFLFVT